MLRIRKLKEEMKKINLSSFFINSQINRMYISGFSGSRGDLLITKNKIYLFTDARYIGRAYREIKKNEIEIIDVSQNYLLKIKKILAKHKIKQLGIEADSMSLNFYLEFKRKLYGVKLVKIFDLIKKIRAIKEKEEIKKIQKAIKITDTTFLYIKNYIKENLSNNLDEKEIAWEIEKFIREHNGDGVSFEIIVASGKNSAIPHHKTGDRKIRKNDIILIDFGAVLNSYMADMTRTIFIGEPTKKQKDIYKAVLKTQEEMINRIRPGMKVEKIEKAANKMVEELGYEGKFNHSLSHGVGLEIHEFPRYLRNKQEVFEENMVFTVEPGIYIPDFCGVRIEDIVCLKNYGACVLTKSSNKIEDMIILV